MKIESLFCMKGCGYLQAITHSSGQMVAMFAILNDPKKSPAQDCVMLDMVVHNKRDQQLLTGLLKLAMNGHSVIVQFESEYQMLMHTSSGQTPEDPRSIVTLKTQLLKLEKCFIDGQRARFNNPPLYAVN